MSALDHMLYYATELGWPVLPIRPGGKKPLGGNGVKHATTDPATIEHWLRRWPDAGVAVATGAPGPQGLDVDDLAAAADVVARATATGAPTAASWRGRHFYFAGTEASTVVLGYGELRGRGSYLILPPTIHPSGREYVWLDSPHGPLPPVPNWLAPMAVSIKAPLPGEPIPEGGRNTALWHLAFDLVTRGVIDPDVIRGALLEVNRVRCQPPMPEREVVAVAEWAVTTRAADRERTFAERARTEPLTGEWWARRPEDADDA